MKSLLLEETSLGYGHPWASWCSLMSPTLFYILLNKKARVLLWSLTHANQVQQVQGVVWIFERAQASKSHQVQKTQKEREGKEREVWRGEGGEACGENKSRAVFLLGQKFEHTKNNSGIGHPTNLWRLSTAWSSFRQSIGWSGIGNLAMLLWECGHGNWATCTLQNAEVNFANWWSQLDKITKYQILLKKRQKLNPYKKAEDRIHKSFFECTQNLKVVHEERM